MSDSQSAAQHSRRTFLAASAASVAATSVLQAGVYAAGSDLLKVGLIGCGGRGTGAASQALKADEGTELYALADAFEDILSSSRRRLSREFNVEGKPPRVTVDDSRAFVGFDGYQKVIDCCDVVLLASTPHFRPEHLRAAVAAGRHIFCEKPIAVDAPGVQSVLQSTEIAREKKLSLVSGLCWRYHHGKRAIFEQIRNGAIGDIVSMECNYMSGGVWDPRRTREQCSSDMEYQMRNWYYYTWLSGDFNVEQHIHSLDKMMWAMNDEPPVTISAIGGRQVRTDPKYGNIYDHFNVTYTWPNGVKAFARCRHWNNCETEVEDYIVGTKGRADVMAHTITDHSGKQIWKFEGEGGDMYQIEHDELFASIRNGQPINNGIYMSRSTLMAIAGRMAAYTGQRLSWSDVETSKENLTPPAYEWGAIDAAPVAIPGRTKFV